ncbi:MAG: hypothetical protein JWL91_1821 [Sphingomonas bacterium]|nr:hypothetical protein [Sphingomonas bacterium]MDB5689945.1 hypothetical protein [Sphingomonas bacterium]
MIATRFRSVYWVGGVAVAALGCYLVSQRVAAERATLVRVETAIVIGERQIRSLETEIGTRAGMKQIERWNVEVLSLSAPKAGQFVADEVQLASLVQPAQPAMEAPAAVQVVAIDEAPAALPHVTRASYEAPVAVTRVAEAHPKVERARPAKAKEAKPRPERERLADSKRDRAPERNADDTPRVRSAVFVKPATHKGTAPQKVALLDEKLLGDLGKLARNERTGGKRNR